MELDKHTDMNTWEHTLYVEYCKKLTLAGSESLPVNMYNAFFWFCFDPYRANSEGRTDGTGASYCYVLSRKQTFNPLCFFQIPAAYCGAIPRRPE